MRLDNADLTGAVVDGANFRSTTAYGFTAEQLYSTATYQQGNLSGMRFDSNDLSGWKFAGKDLTGATFDSANVAGADFTDAVVAETTFRRGSEFRPEERTISAQQLYSTASYKNRDLQGISLRGGDLSGWSFARQNLTAATFRGADLSRAYFRRADLSDADFQGADLSNAILSGAIVTGAIFDGPVPSSGATLLASGQLYSTASYQSGDLRGISLTQTNLQGWDFSRQNLTGASFHNAVLIGADFTGADLTGADFGDAKLADAEFSGAIVQGADFSPDRYHPLTCAQLYSTASYQAGDLRGIFLGGHDLAGWDFTGQDLTGASFAWSELHGADLTDAIVRDAVFDATVPDDPLRVPLEAEEFYATASYQARDLRGVSLNDNDLRSWSFAGQDLTGASFRNAEVGNADFSGAIVREASFDWIRTPGSYVPPDGPLQAEQLYATASYQAADLRGISLGDLDLRGWDFTGQDLTGARFRQADLTTADFTGADLTGADFHRAQLPAEMPMLPVLAEATVILGQDTTLAGSVRIDEAGTLQLEQGPEAARFVSIFGDVVNNGLIATGEYALRIEGEVTGTGDTTGYVIFAGGYSPGASPAIATHENLVLEATNVLTMELGGPVPGKDHDQLIVTGTALLDGTLAIELVDGYFPRAEDRLALFDWAAVSGTFSDVSAPEWLQVDLSSLYADGTLLVVVPEPGTLALLLSGALGVLVWARRKRRRRSAGPGGFNGSIMRCVWAAKPFLHVAGTQTK